jgi:nucleoside diphosphate kinase
MSATVITQRALVAVTPNSVLKRWTADILQACLDAGLELVKRSDTTLKPEQATLFHHSKEEIKKPCVLLLLEGSDPLNTVRDLHGPTKAEEGDLRPDFLGPDTIYCSSHLKEIELFFPQKPKT